MIKQLLNSVITKYGDKNKKSVNHDILLNLVQ